MALNKNLHNYKISIVVNDNILQHKIQVSQNLFVGKTLNILEYIDKYSQCKENKKFEFHNGMLIFYHLPIPLSVWKQILPSSNKKTNLIEFFGGWSALEVKLGELLQKDKKCVITYWRIDKEGNDKKGGSIGSYIGSYVGNQVENAIGNYASNEFNKIATPASIAFGLGL